MMLSRRSKALLIALPITLFAVVLVAFVSSHVKKGSEDESHEHIRIANSACSRTQYPDLCFSTVLTFPYIKCNTLPDIISSTIKQTLTEVKQARLKIQNFDARLAGNCQKPLDQQRDCRAIDDCLELLDQTASELETSLVYVFDTERIFDAQAQLSAAMTYQYTCLDGFAYSHNQSIRNYFKGSLYNISRHISNTLAMVSKLPGADDDPSNPNLSKKLFGSSKGKEFPAYMNWKDIGLLQATTTTTNFSMIGYDLIVAKDGSGNFTTIKEALAMTPNSSKTRFVIYIKEGEYYEYVEVEKKKTNIMFLGDGMGKTIIKGNRSYGDGWTTFHSATLAVVGQGFIARGITVENYAGPIMRQAVALRSGSDHSAFYKCSFIGYQDTLYVHALLQFYRECDIYGTVDFIFGDAIVVFQKCNLYARRPLDKQKNVFTAQGRKDWRQTSGISIIESNIGPAPELIPVQHLFKSYLGRPWKEYSRTVIMRCNISDVIDAAGWLELNKTFALSTLYYGEYMNVGSGANTTGRVTWPGFRVITNETEAAQFTAGSFIHGSEWLNTTGVPYYLNLTA